MTAIEIFFWIIQLMYKLTLKPGTNRKWAANKCEMV